jgi:hypothetical protein
MFGENNEAFLESFLIGQLSPTIAQVDGDCSPLPAMRSLPFSSNKNCLQGIKSMLQNWNISKINKRKKRISRVFLFFSFHFSFPLEELKFFS